FSFQGIALFEIRSKLKQQDASANQQDAKQRLPGERHFFQAEPAECVPHEAEENLRHHNQGNGAAGSEKLDALRYTSDNADTENATEPEPGLCLEFEQATAFKSEAGGE